MEDLLAYILEGITGTDDFEISREEEGDKVNLNVDMNQEYMGLVIGKGGRTIKAIQDILRVKGRLEDKIVFINVNEKEDQSSTSAKVIEPQEDIQTDEEVTETD